MGARIRAGRLRQRVDIRLQAGTDTVGDGSRANSPTTIATGVAVELLPAGAADVERQFAHLAQMPISALVRLRYRADIAAKCELVYGSRVLIVRGIQNVEERNVELLLACEEFKS